MSDEFTIDIDKALENAKTNDLAGGFTDKYPTPIESLKKAVNNCVNLAGLDKRVMGDIDAGKYTSYDCYDSTRRHYT